MVAGGTSLPGRFCGLLGSISQIILYPVSCVATESCRIAASELRPYCPPSAPTTSSLRAVRLLGSASGPQAAETFPRLAETREAWHPIQGLSVLAAGVAPSASTSTSSEGSTGHPGSQPVSITTQGGVGASSNGDTSGKKAQHAPEMDEVFHILKEMGLQPGRHCVVGDGLAEVEVGLYLNGVKVALDMEKERPSHTMVSDAKSYALRRATRSMLQAHGWHPVTLVASDWHQLNSEQKTNYLAHCINHALGRGHGGHGQGHGHDHGHGHKHGHGSCGTGCSGSGCSGSGGRRH